MQSEDPEHRELLRILKAEDADASSFYSSELAQSQTTAMDRYNARPYGDEVDGRSKVVTHDIEDTINWVMPHLMRTFEPSDDLITCDDDSLDDGSEILTATAQYLRHVFFRQLGGEDIIHDFAFDGLLQKIGILRTTWERPTPGPPIIRDGVTAEQLLRYHADPEYQILEIAPDEEGEPQQQEALEVTGESVEQPQALPGLMQQPAPQPATGLMQGQQQSSLGVLQPVMPDGIPLAATYSIKLQRMPRAGKPLVEVIAPEHFRITARSSSIELASYHSAVFPDMYLADIVAMYPERAHLLDPDGSYTAPADDDDELSTDSRVDARFVGEQLSNVGKSDDEYRERVTLRVEYLQCDYDRDGIVELRRIVRCGDVILENDIVEESEFTVWSPIRVSHRAIGRSVADTLLDIQKIRTVLTRRAMDSLSQSLTPRTFYNKRNQDADNTFVDQLLDHDVGSAIGVDGNPNEAVMVQVTPDVSASAFQAIEYWDRRSEEASGVNRHAMGIQPQAITDTKGGIENLQSAANARIEQVARHIGKSLGVAFGKLLRIIVRHQHTPQIFKVSGKRVTWDARQVSDQMTVSVHVGMTAESREKRLAFLASVLGAQKELMMQLGPANPVATLKNIRHTLGQMMTVGGYRDAKPFFAEVPEGWQPPEPGPDPKTAEVQGKLQLQQAEMQGKQQLAQAELQHTAQMRQAEFQRDVQLQQLKLASDEQRNTAEMENRKQLEEMKLAADAQSATLKAEMERQIAEMKTQHEMALAERKMAMEAQLAREQMEAEMELARWKTGQEIKLARSKNAQQFRASNSNSASGDSSTDGNSSVRFGGQTG